MPIAPAAPSVAVTPPVTSESQPIAPAPQPPVATAVPVEAKPVVAQAQPVKPPLAGAAEAASKAYGPVKRGETLARIASKVKTEGVTLEQMLVGLYRANPDAFAGNMNHLKTGKILHVPEKERFIATSQSEAVKEVRVEVANWNAYRQKLADAAGETAAREPKSAARGKITTKVDDKAAGKAAPKEVLKLSKGEPAAGKASAKDAPRSVAKRMHLLEEEAIAREKALVDANNRIAELEKTIKNMQHILEIKGQVPATKPSPQPVPPAKGDATKSEPTTAPAEKSAAAELPKGDAQQAGKGAEQLKPKPKVVAPPTPAPEPDLIEQIVGEPVYLAAAGGVLALLGLGGYLFVRRRTQAGIDEPVDEKIEAEIGKKTAAAGGGVFARLSGYLSAPRGAQAGAGNVVRERIAPELGKKAAATAAMNAAAPAIAAPAAGGDGDVDPLAEADMYLNFGRDVQAEEVLKDALEKTPGHEEAQVKLLQIYAGRKDKAAFEKIARSLHAQTKGTGDNWVKAAAMGYALDSANALYEAGKSAPVATQVVGGVGPDLDFNFDLDAASSASVADADSVSAPVAEADKTAGMQPGEIAGAAVTPPPAEPAVTVDVAGNETVATDVARDSTAPMSNMIDFSFDATVPVHVPAESSDGSKGSARDGTVIVSPDQQHKAVEPEHSVDLEFSAGDQPETSSEKPAALAGTDMPMLEPEFKLDLGGSKTSVPPAPEFKLDAISLNFEEGPTTEIPKAEKGAKDDHWHDVQAKFDLAKAYQEMGEKGGAREILQEVIKEGDAGQRAEAQKLLASLD